MRPDIHQLADNDAAWAEERAMMMEAERRLNELDPDGLSAESTTYHHDDWTGDTALMLLERELESRHSIAPGCGFWMVDLDAILELDAKSPYKLREPVLLLSCPDPESPEDWQEWAYQYDLDLDRDEHVMVRITRCGRVDGRAMDRESGASSSTSRSRAATGSGSSRPPARQSPSSTRPAIRRREGTPSPWNSKPRSESCDETGAPLSPGTPGPPGD